MQRSEKNIKDSEGLGDGFKMQLERVNLVKWTPMCPPPSLTRNVMAFWRALVSNILTESIAYLHIKHLSNDQYGLGVIHILNIFS